MSYKGKMVKVRFYHFFEDKPFKEVVGKVKSIHTSAGTKDTSTIEIIDNKGNIHTGGCNNYFNVVEVKA